MLTNYMLTNYSRMSTFLTFAPLHFRRMLSHLKKKLGPPPHDHINGGKSYTPTWGTCFFCLVKDRPLRCCSPPSSEDSHALTSASVRQVLRLEFGDWAIRVVVSQNVGFDLVLKLKDSSMYYSCIYIYYIDEYYVHIHVTYDYICGIIYDMNKITENCAFSRLRRASICWKSSVQLCALYTRNHAITWINLITWNPDRKDTVYFSLMYRTGKRTTP